VKGAKAMKTKTHLILGCPASGTLPPGQKPSGSTMPQNAGRDPRFIKYLLGELPAPERTKLEDQYLGDDETFKRLVAAEEELMFATALIACLETTAELSGT
jgi:hypothetical protein